MPYSVWAVISRQRHDLQSAAQGQQDQLAPPPDDPNDAFSFVYSDPQPQQRPG
jgi:hypothetical protein